MEVLPPIERPVLLVEDHPVYRDGLKAIINRHPQLRVEAEADNIHDALRLLEEIAPEVLVTDLRLAQSSGHDLIETALRGPGLSQSPRGLLGQLQAVGAGTGHAG